MPGTFCDFATGQSEKEQTENEIKSGESDQREDRVAVANYFAVTIPRVKESVNQPRLATQLGRHPAKSIGDVGVGEREHQNPEQQTAGFEPASPILQCGKTHENDEQRHEREHDVKRVVEKLEVVRPLILREIVQTVDKTSEVAVSEKTQCAGDFDRIVESLRGNVWLTNESNRRHRAALEFPFHRSERDRLMMTNHLGLRIASWESNEKRCDQTKERSRAQIKSRLNPMKSPERI